MSRMRNGEKRRVRLAFVVLVLLTGIMHMLGLYNVLEAAVVITQRFIILTESHPGEGGNLR